MLGVCTKFSPHLYTHLDLGKWTPSPHCTSTPTWTLEGEHRVLNTLLYPPGPRKANSPHLYTHLVLGKWTYYTSPPTCSAYHYTGLVLGKWTPSPHHTSTPTWTLKGELTTPLHPPEPWQSEHTNPNHTYQWLPKMLSNVPRAGTGKQGQETKKERNKERQETTTTKTKKEGRKKQERQ